MVSYKWKDEKFKLRFKATLVFVVYDVLVWFDLFISYKQLYFNVRCNSLFIECFFRFTKKWYLISRRYFNKNNTIDLQIYN